MSLEEIKAALAVAVLIPNNFDVFKLLDQLNTLEELDEVRPILGTYERNLPFYESWIRLWPRPALSSEFVAEYPQVSSLLDEPWKVRVFLRAAQFIKSNSMVMGDVFEDILSQRRTGKDRVSYQIVRGDEWSTALTIVWRREVQARAVCEIMLPYAISFEGTTDCKLFINWPKVEELVAAAQTA